MKKMSEKIKMSVSALYLALTRKETPLWIKIVAVGTVIYVLSPFDAIPDFPFLGYLDDITLLSLVIFILNKGIPSDILQRCREEVERRMKNTVDEVSQKAEENIIDGKFKEKK
ncbi:MAG: DUF1232 domain-containing protein [Flexilinea flocculi]|jgi:uncharacterized membrane protein YkvA (DUF1232 family)|nr:DUF1232 domain-containing protein [Flexilinea flocculi]